MMDEKEVTKIVEEKIRTIINQFNIFPGTIKERHVGEGVKYLRAGLVANKPTLPEKDGAVYYAKDENKLYIGDGGAWVSTTLA